MKKGSPKNLLLVVSILVLAVTGLVGCEKNPDDTTFHPFTTATEYINYTINGVPYSYTVPQDNFTCIVDNQAMFFIFGFNTSVPDTVRMLVIGRNTGTMNLNGFIVPQFINDPISSILPPRSVTTSEYPLAVGEYLAGNFSLIFVGQPPTNINYNVTCNFRVRRDQ